jgi:uncharacterized repeat protein (TIGR03803 family)
MATLRVFYLRTIIAHRALAIAALALLSASLVPCGASAYTLKTLYDFCLQSECTDGSEPVAGVIIDSNGNLFGTTAEGGIANCGGVCAYGVDFELSPSGAEWNYQTLYSFCSVVTNDECADGSSADPGVVEDDTGDLYGATYYGGNNNSGMVYKLASNGQQTVLYSFCPAGGNCTDGAHPYSGVILKSGAVYGTVTAGGANNAGGVFEVTAAGKYKLLCSFCALGSCADGSVPYAGVIVGKSGNLYGTTTGGGAHGYGAVFELSPGKPWTETVLYSFCSQPADGFCVDGASPYAGVILDKSGNLRGATIGGGLHNWGAVFELSPGTPWTETVLYNFCSTLAGGVCTDGARPYGGLIDQAGTLYGTTTYGGTGGAYPGGGTVFSLSAKGELRILRSFCRKAKCADGANPKSGVVRDATGNLYGTTFAGGAHLNGGTVFELLK